MNDRLNDVTLRCENYKCFGADGAGYDAFKPINVIVGRNNSGKSALLDLLELACNRSTVPPGLGFKGGSPKFTLKTRIDEPSLQRVFPENTSGGGIPGNHWQYGRRFIGRHLTRQMNTNPGGDRFTFEAIDPPFELEGVAGRQGRSLAAVAPFPFDGLTFKRLRADRDVRPELDANERFIKEDGSGFTNTVQNYVNKASLPSDVVEAQLLRELNTIFAPDARFSDIILQQTWGSAMGDLP